MELDVLVQNVWSYLNIDKTMLDRKILKDIEKEMSYIIQEYVRSRKTYVDLEYTLFERGKMRYPTGLISNLGTVLDKNNIAYNIYDQRELPVSKDKLIIHGKTLRDYQEETLEKSLKAERGIVKVATGGGKCINHNSLCLTQNGMLTFTELLEEYVPVGEYKNKNIIVATPLQFNGCDMTTKIYNDGTTNSYRIMTKCGYELIGTVEHKIQTINEYGEMVWNKLKNIKNGDICVIAKDQNMFGNNDIIKEDDGYWLGLLIGDGSFVYKDSTNLYNCDEHIKMFAKNYIKKLGFNVGGDIDRRSNKELESIKLHSIDYRQYLTNLGFGYDSSVNKIIPRIIRESKKEVVAAFIRGIMETDGYVSKKELQLGLSNKKIIKQIQYMLLNFGVVSCYSVKKTNKEDSHLLSIRGVYIKKYMEEIGLDEGGWKFKEIQNLLKKKNNTNIDLIYNIGDKIKQLKLILRKKVGYHNISKYLDGCGLSHRVIESWYKNRKPSRQSLKKFLLCLNSKPESCDPDVKNIVAELLNLTEDKFFYDVIDYKTVNYSHNYDFVIPDTHSFVANGFINHNTTIGCSIVAKLNLKTMFIVHTVDLLEQAYDEFTSMLQLDIGRVGGGHCDIKQINICTIQTLHKALDLKYEAVDDECLIKEKIPKKVLNRKEEIRQMIEECEVILVDECQHAKASSFVNLMKSAPNVYYRFGLSATPYKYDSSDIILNAYSGREIVSISASYLIDRNFLVPPKIYFLDPNRLGGYQYVHGRFNTVYKEWIVENQLRNNLISDCVERLLNLDKTVLITVTQVKHGELVMKTIDRRLSGVKASFIHGEVKSDKRKELLNDIRHRDLKVLVGTSVADEGLDLPALDSAIIAGGGKSLIKSLQRVGRTLRPYENKKEAIVVDFYDHLRYLTGHSKKRMQIYKQEPKFQIFKDF